MGVCNLEQVFKVHSSLADRNRLLLRIGCHLENLSDGMQLKMTEVEIASL